MDRIFKSGNINNSRKMTLKNIASKEQFDKINKSKDIKTIDKVMAKAHKLGRFAF